MNLAQSISLLAQYKLEDRLEYRGLKISIENKAGSVRSGKDKDGNPWSVQMQHPYGYVRNSMGVDGDHVDCFIGPDEDAANVYVIHSKVPETGKYDEDKCMLGFPSADAAKKAFLANFTSPDFFGSMDTIPFDKFKEKVLATKDKPKKITAAALTIGTQVTVDGLAGRGIVTSTYKDRVTIRFRNGLTMSRHVRYVHPLSENTQNKSWRDDNRHELESAKEWTELQEGAPTDIRPVNGGRIVKQGTQFCVKHDGVDKNFGCFPSREEAQERLTMKIKNPVLAGGPGSGCKGENCGRPRSADRTDPRQTSIAGPKHGDELREWYARRQKQVDAYGDALNKSAQHLVVDYRHGGDINKTYHKYSDSAENFYSQAMKLLKSEDAQDHLRKARAELDKADNNVVKNPRIAMGNLNGAYHYLRLAVQAGPIPEEHKRILKEDPRQLRLFNNGQSIKADVDGEPMTGNMSHAHIDPQIWFKPPSLKNAKPVPVDNPGEKDDEYLDVTKRNSKDTQTFRMKQLKKQGPNTSIPARTTLIPHETGVFNPNVFGSAKVIQRPAKVIGAKRTLVSYENRGCV